MGLESATYISQLNVNNPVGGVDNYSTADDHLRLVKSVLQAQFPNLGAAAVTPTAAQLNFVTGVTSAIQTQLDARELLANKNANNGYAGLNASAQLLDARVQQSNVTQHQAALTISGSQLTALSVPTGALADASVTLAKLANLVQGSVIGRQIAAGTGVPQSLTPTDLLAMILTVDGPTSGLDADFLDGSSGAAYLNSSNQASGTLPDARFPATLPAISGANLTSLNASNLASGAIPDARVAQTNVTQHMGAGYARNISSPAKAGTVKTLSTSAPSGGSDGDIWYRY